ncbi:MAG TPA: hypothetical protein EYN91_19395 [Candidatus Melainabacteria bacterium]|nr:hypothetical protein [Candidatus Melainabacteria bacterium]HIN65838.1 hypothetical protein [Candidatus Obscuribacterales bacterium]
MSLSQEPAFSYLKDNFVVGYKDITGASYAGVSGVHMPTGNAVSTTNGAGPHNLQTFVLAPDGTVMTCLPGYWAPQDLVSELKLGQDLYKVWNNKSLSRADKDSYFRQMHQDHFRTHSLQEQRRSRMQGFDMKYEAKNRLHTSDCILDSRLAATVLQKGMKPPMGAFKTTDQIMHDRMSQRPFTNYMNFDVVAYTDYGRPFYNKNEDQRTATGEVNKDLARAQPLMGNVDEMKGAAKRARRQQQQRMAGGRMLNRAGGYLARRGVQTFVRAMR